MARKANRTTTAEGDAETGAETGSSETEATLAEQPKADLPEVDAAVTPVPADESPLETTEPAASATEAEITQALEGADHPASPDAAEQAPFSQPADLAADPVGEPEIAAPHAAAPAVAPVRKGSALGRFMGALAGGVLAAGAGFGLAAYGIQQGWPLITPPPPVPVVSPDEVSGLKAEVGRLSAALAEAQSRADAEPDITALEKRLAELEIQPGGADPADTGLTERLNAIEQQMTSLPEGASADEIRAEIEAQLAARLDEARETARELRAESDAYLKETGDRASLLALRGAFESGTGYAAALEAAAQRGLTVPAVVQQFAADPVRLSDLQTSFPEASRAALTEARKAGQANAPDLVSRLLGFAQLQTGARSLVPREGSDPDAVLSRMEAAVSAADLPAALALIPELPEPAVRALDSWKTKAERWEAARAALVELVPAE